MLKFIVTDRKTIEAGLLVRSSYIVISIRDSAKRRVKVRKQAGLRDLLYLAFDDAEPTDQMASPAAITLMTPRQARKIWEFVDKYRESIGAVVVHCEQGMSRSPAVVAALCKAMGGDDRRFWREYQPNRYVYRLVLEAAPRPMGHHRSNPGEKRCHKPLGTEGEVGNLGHLTVNFVRLLLQDRTHYRQVRSVSNQSNPLSIPRRWIDR